MKLTGSYKINLEKQKVWDALNDPETLYNSEGRSNGVDRKRLRFSIRDSLRWL